MAAINILLPYNFTIKDRKAMQFVIDTFQPRPDARVTLFHAYTPLPAIDASEEIVRSKLQSNLNYLNQKISEQETAFTAARLELIQGGFPESRVTVVFKPRKRELAAELLELHRKERFDVIVLSHGSHKVTRFFTGSVHNRILADLQDTTVCIVS
jgi:nucleotide-binding universal stress UspA family protein